MIALLKRFVNDQSFALVIISHLLTIAVAVTASATSGASVEECILAGAAVLGINATGSLAAVKLGRQS